MHEAWRSAIKKLDLRYKNINHDKALNMLPRFYCFAIPSLHHKRPCEVHLAKNIHRNCWTYHLNHQIRKHIITPLVVRVFHSNLPCPHRLNSTLYVLPLTRPKLVLQKLKYSAHYSPFTSDFPTQFLPTPTYFHLIEHIIKIYK